MTKTIDNIVITKPPKPASLERNLVGLVKGGGITMFGKMYTNASRLAIAFFLARFLGAEQYGLYQLALNSITLVSGIALLGLDIALVRFVAIAVSHKNEKSLWGILQIGIGIPSIIGVFTGVGLFALAYPIADIVFNDMRLVPLLQIAGLVIPSITTSDVLVGAIRGFKNMHFPVIAQFIVQPTFRLLATLILALSGLDAFRAIIIFGASDLIATLILINYLNKIFPLKRPLRSASYNLKEIFSYAFPDWLAGMMDRFRLNIQALLIGSLNTIAGVGVFAVANQINILGNDFYSSINISARPLIAELHEHKQNSQLERVYQTATKWSLIVNLPLFLLIVLFPVELLSIFGESFTQGTTALIILAAANVVNVGTGMCGTILNMTGYTKLKLANNSISLVLSILINVLLIPRMGIIGAAISALIVTAVINGLRIIQVYHLIHLRTYNWSFIKPLFATLITYIAAWQIKGLTSQMNDFISLTITGVVICGIFFSSIFLMGFSPEDHIIIRSIKKKALATFSGRNRNDEK